MTVIRVNKTDAVTDALRGLMPSPLPAVVFTSLAELCVPMLSDCCHILIEEDGLAPYLIQRPLTGTPTISARHDDPHRSRNSWSGQWVNDHMVQTAFDQTRTGATIGYRGSVLHLWHRYYQPTGTDLALAQVAVDHAVNILHREQARTRPDPWPHTKGLQTRSRTVTDPVRARADADTILHSMRSAT